MLPHSLCNAVYILAMSAFVLTAVSATGKGKEKAEMSVVEEDEFKEFIFRGSIEPKFDTKRMKEPYQVSVFCKTTIMKKGMGWREPVVEKQIDHHFSVKLLVRRREKHSVSNLKNVIKSVFPNWHPTELDYASNGIEQIRVQIKAQFHDGGEMIRTWIIAKPDFSLHYELNVGVLKSGDYWLRGKIAVPTGTKLFPDDTFRIFSYEDNPFFVTYFGEYSYGDILTAKIENQRHNSAELVINGNLLSFAFKLDGEKVNEYLAKFPENPIIRLFFERNEFKKYMKKKEEERKKIEESRKQHDNIVKKAGGDDEATIHNTNKAETSGTAAGADEQSAVDNNVCPICLDDEEDQPELHSQTCTHRFHKDCIDKWTADKPFCPTCRGILDGVSQFLFEDPVFSNEHYSFEYKIIMRFDEKHITNVHEFWGQTSTEGEQKEFLKRQIALLPARRVLFNLVLRREASLLQHGNEISFADIIPLAENRIQTVKVNRQLTTNINIKEKGKMKIEQ